MTSGRKPKSPIYVLPHGIEVIGEYPPRGRIRYWRVRIRPHAFFSGVRVVCGGIYIHRSRALLAAKLGRALTPADHAHHMDGNCLNDTFDNITLLSAAEHNRHHKTGTQHRPESRTQTSASLKRLYAAGLRTAPPIKNRDSKGRISSCA